MSDLDLLELASRLAREAGELIRHGRKGGVHSASTKSTATDVVTEFDRAAERLITEGIRAARPDDGIIGEEGTDVAGASGVRWLIDPIDGTTNFLYDLPGYAVSIAALVDDATHAGAVYVPATDELFTATSGGGAQLNGTAIHCGSTADLGQALVATGFSYARERRQDQGARFQQMIGSIRDIRRLGAASTDLCYLAAGRLDVYFEQWLAPWDWAAGELIAREAGCRTGHFDGRPLVWDAAAPAVPGVLAAIPTLFDPMVDLLSRTEPGVAPAPGPGIM